ncbi:hypothetical protein V757_00170 [Pelistega indica]|uniref:SecDF P1 head subdomain domain-containing protein n=1 Tax=Pelistega indica TaxID=1414851 RepID=V8G9P0_9BURK|nr:MULTISPECIES: hypothetical protein [Pelistega]ETD73120.1 hypothetical protein V757_00170 [Pelistega indica]
MRLNRLFLISGIVVSLAGCQTIDKLLGINSSSSSSSLPSNIPTTPPPSKANKPEQAKVNSSLVLFIGATSPIDGYTKVTQKGRTVYVDPTQTLTYSDLSNAIAAVDERNQPYLDLVFSPQGTQKLANLTGKNIGKNIIFTLKNELISIFDIDARNTSGTLHIPMQSAKDAQIIEQRILDGE